MIEVIPVPLLRDNYGYLLADRKNGSAVVIDPSEAEPIRAALSRECLSLRAIWCTHHHWDHVGGIEDLLASSPTPIPVLGSAYDLAHQRIVGQSRGLGEGETVEHGAVLFEVWTIPGHTLGAIAYVAKGMVFTGDTLFLAGCGRVFEGTMPMMRTSLSRLRDLPPETKVYCGHEYTEKNLEFAHAVEPQEPAIQFRLELIRELRAEGNPTIPGTITDELATNPFLRWESTAVRAFAAARGSANSADDVFARLREAKDDF